MVLVRLVAVAFAMAMAMRSERSSSSNLPVGQVVAFFLEQNLKVII